MTLIETINIVFSIIGAAIFIISIYYERAIIKKLQIIKKGGKWVFILSLTILFFFGYIVNIIAIVMQNTNMQVVFNAIVYLFGGIFVLIVVYISYSTYKAIFDAAEQNTGEDLTLEKK